MRLWQILGIGSWLGATLAPGVAGATPLDIKTGLWQMETAMAMQGGFTLPDSVLDAMPPERQAAMRAAMARMQNVPHQSRKCITAAELERGFNPHNVPHAQCTSTPLKQTARRAETRVVCTGTAEAATTSTMMFGIDAIDQETLAGSGTFNGLIRGKPAAGTVTIHGKFLSAACGDVAPAD